MVDVQQACVGAFEEDRMSVPAHVVQCVDGVGDVGCESPTEFGVFGGQGIGIQRGSVDAECGQLP